MVLTSKPSLSRDIATKKYNVRQKIAILSEYHKDAWTSRELASLIDYEPNVAAMMQPRNTKLSSSTKRLKPINDCEKLERPALEK